MKKLKVTDITAENLRRDLRRETKIDREWVRTTMLEISTDGDKKIIELAKKFDTLGDNMVRISADEILEAKSTVTSTVTAALEQQIKNLTNYHRMQVRDGFRVDVTESISAGQLVRPIDRVGLYIPGGTAPLVSTLAMLLVPATLASVPSVMVCTPCGTELHPAMAYLLNRFQVSEAYRIGGVQAVGAMTFGTDSIQKVRKIFGPGNQYVNTAKMIATEFGAAIDMPAGPSELLIICDETANADFVAADILAQAEHGADSPVIVITTDTSFPNRLDAAIAKAFESLSRKSYAAQSLELCTVLTADSITAALNFSNDFACEHVSIQTGDAEQYLGSITNAGSVFLGHYSPTALGDYISGPNHTLPTGGSAAACSGITVSSFQKTISWQRVNERAFPAESDPACTLAMLEGLQGHARSMEIRKATNLT